MVISVPFELLAATVVWLLQLCCSVAAAFVLQRYGCSVLTIAVSDRMGGALMWDGSSYYE